MRIHVLTPAFPPFPQVMREYAAWADRMIGHWKVEADGHKSPNVSCCLLASQPSSSALGGSKYLQCSIHLCARYVPPCLPSVTDKPSSLPPGCAQVRLLVKPLLGMFHGEPRAKKWRAAVRGPGRCRDSEPGGRCMCMGCLHPGTILCSGCCVAPQQRWKHPTASACCACLTRLLPLLQLLPPRWTLHSRQRAP